MSRNNERDKSEGDSDDNSERTQRQSETETVWRKYVLLLTRLNNIWQSI